MTSQKRKWDPTKEHLWGPWEVKGKETKKLVGVRLTSQTCTKALASISGYVLSAWKRPREKSTLPRWSLCRCWLTRLSGSTPASSAWAAGAGDGRGWSPSDPWSWCDRGTTSSTSSGWSPSHSRTPGRASRLRRHATRHGWGGCLLTCKPAGYRSGSVQPACVGTVSQLLFKWKPQNFIKIKAVSWSWLS